MIDEMNQERVRCGSPPFVEDERLTAAAKAKLAHYPLSQLSHLTRNGRDNMTPWAQKFQFPGDFHKGTLSEGLMFGSTEPAGLKPNERGDSNRYRPGLLTHHNDLINPKWNRVGYAGGRCKSGQICSVTLYGRVDEESEFEFKAY
jgi:hypothetical protein